MRLFKSKKKKNKEETKEKELTIKNEKLKEKKIEAAKREAIKENKKEEVIEKKEELKAIKEDIKKKKQKRVKVNNEKLKFIFKFVIVPLILILIAFRIFVIKTAERELYFSTESYITRNEFNVGSEGYGTVSSINVNPGDIVNKGDILYTYANASLDQKIFELENRGIDAIISENPDGNIDLNEFNKNIEFIVRAKQSGTIKEINIDNGEFITKDTDTMIMESSETYIKASIKVPVHLTDRIKNGQRVVIKLNPVTTVEGYIKNVYPEYDPNRNIINVDVFINSNELTNIDFSNLYTGTRVQTIVVSEDPFTREVENILNKVKVPVIKEYLKYEID